jgi:hypothetical protein
MGIKVNIDDVIEGMEMQFDDSSHLLNIKTGEVIFIQDEFLRDAEDEEPFDHLPDWQQEQMILANDILDHDENYVDLPSKFDIHEYNMMEEFCISVKDPKSRDILLRAIRGKGAFRRFKDKIPDVGLQQDWYDYRDKCYRQIAIDFCEENNLEYDDNKRGI